MMFLDRFKRLFSQPSNHPLDWSKLSRIEVIDESGRIFAAWDKFVEPSIQDDGRTLKLFISFRQVAASAMQTLGRVK